MKTIVVHSGGMDSSICLKLAVSEFGADNVLSLGFSYGQRHLNELDNAKRIADHFGVKRVIIDLNCMSEITDNALTNRDLQISHSEGESPNTLVTGRNGLMARVAAIHAEHLGANSIYMGIIEVEEANSGYRDCSRKYMDLIEAALRLDFDNESFQIRTPLVFLTKKETLELIEDKNDLLYLVENTITCYEGIPKEGCKLCPACKLRNSGLKDYVKAHPNFKFSYLNKI